MSLTNKTLYINFQTTFLFLLCLFISIGLSLEAYNPTYLYHNCTNATTYIQNSIFKSNLDQLLSSLSSNATRRYHNATVGADGNGGGGRGDPSSAVYGLFLCRGDVKTTACSDCVTFAVKDVVKRCPVQKEAIIWYDECQLRYSNWSFFGTVAERPRFALLNTANVTDPERFNRLVNVTMKAAAADAARVETRFATKEENINGFQRLYNLVQCTPDLSGADCQRCLADAVERLPICCAGKIGGRVVFASCCVRYEVYPFYNLVASNSTPPPALTPPSTNGKGGTSTTTIVSIVVPIAVALIIFVLGFCFLTKRAKNKKIAIGIGHKKAGGDDYITTIESLQFDLATIEAATDKFSADNKLGKGGFGEVYKGTLLNGQQIAVKRLSASSGQGAQEFKNEVVLLAKLQHRNLVTLLGFCLEGQEKLLIYEFVPNKSLDHFLFDPEKQGQLDWSRRYKIIGGIARGILYLHEDSQLRIIHRDLKASNILLDADMNAKISDFGMAKIFAVDQTRGNTSRIVGTYGYMSPEYAMHGQFSLKYDVYSFGVLILEIISGRKNNSFYQSDYAEDLLNYAWKLWKDGTPLKLLDPTVVHSYSENEVIRCIHIGLLCVQEDPEERPTMKTIVLMFNSYSVTLPVPQQPAFYNRTEADMPQLKFDQSTSVGYPVSVNEASISELYPR